MPGLRVRTELRHTQYATAYMVDRATGTNYMPVHALQVDVHDVPVGCQTRNYEKLCSYVVLATYHVLPGKSPKL